MLFLHNNYYFKFLIYHLCINYGFTNVCLEKSLLPAYNSIESFKLTRLPSIGCLSDSKTEGQSYHVLKLVETTNSTREIDVYILHTETHDSDPVKFSLLIISNYETKWRLHLNGHPIKIYVGNITSIWLNGRKISSKFKRLSKAFIKHMPQLNQLKSFSDFRKRFTTITSYTEIGKETNLININYLNEKAIVPICENEMQFNNSVNFKMEMTGTTNCVNTSNITPNYREKSYYIEAPISITSTNIILVIHSAIGIIEDHTNVTIILNSSENVRWTLLPSGDLKHINLLIITNSAVDESLLSCASLKISFQKFTRHYFAFFHTFLSKNSGWINLNLDQSSRHDPPFQNNQNVEVTQQEFCGTFEVHSDSNLSLLCAVFVSFVAFLIGVLFMSMLWCFYAKCLPNFLHINKCSKDCSAETTPGSISPITIYQVNCN